MQTMSFVNEEMIERALFPLLWMSAEEWLRKTLGMHLLGFVRVYMGEV